VFCTAAFGLPTTFDFTTELFVVVYTVFFGDLAHQTYIYMLYMEQSALYSRSYNTMYNISSCSCYG